MSGAQFTVSAADDGGFYITVAEGVTVYESYSDAIAEIQSKLDCTGDCLLAEVAIETNGDGDDVAVTLEQVGWQQVIQDMAALEDGDSSG